MTTILTKRAIMAAAGMCMMVGLVGPAQAATTFVIDFNGTFSDGSSFSGSFDLAGSTVIPPTQPIGTFTVNLSGFPSLSYSSLNGSNNDTSEVLVNRFTHVAEVLLENTGNTEALSLFFSAPSNSINFSQIQTISAAARIELHQYRPG